MLYYTGTGRKRAPDYVTTLMRAISKKMALSGYVVRTRGMAGAELAFEEEANDSVMRFSNTTVPQEAIDMAAEFHPKWGLVRDPRIQKLHGAIVTQVLGLKLDRPSKYLICWTPDGCISRKTRTSETGSMGTAIGVAEYFDIPVYNLGYKEHWGTWFQWVNSELFDKENYYGNVQTLWR